MTQNLWLNWISVHSVLIIFVSYIEFESRYTFSTRHCCNQKIIDFCVFSLWLQWAYRYFGVTLFDANGVLLCEKFLNLFAVYDAEVIIL